MIFFVICAFPNFPDDFPIDVWQNIYLTWLNAQLFRTLSPASPVAYAMNTVQTVCKPQSAQGTHTEWRQQSIKTSLHYGRTRNGDCNFPWIFGKLHNPRISAHIHCQISAGKGSLGCNCGCLLCLCAGNNTRLPLGTRNLSACFALCVTSTSLCESM